MSQAGAGSAGGSVRAAVRCVVLTAPAGTAPASPGADAGGAALGAAALLRGLERRGAKVRTVSEAIDVMTELAGGAGVVVVDEPHRVRALPELLRAVRAYYPKALVWQYRREGVGALSPLTDKPGVGFGPDAPASPVVGGTRHDAQRATPGTDDATAETADTAEAGREQASSPAAASVSAEELAMLLGQWDEGEDPPRRNDLL